MTELKKLAHEELSSKILAVKYHILEGTTTTVCAMTLRNGFTVIGTSACLNKEDFSQVSGEEIAYNNAFEKLWELYGFAAMEATYSASLIRDQSEQSVMSKLNFPAALRAAFMGFRITRRGWNGINQWVAVSGKPDQATLVIAESFWNKHAKEYAREVGGAAPVQPSFILKNTQGYIVMGWAPSTGDLFAQDWEVIPD